MLLILSNARDATADFFEGRAEDSDLRYVRLDTDRLIGSVKFGYSGFLPCMEVGGVRLVPEDVSAVWYRRPTRLGEDVGTGEGRFEANEWTAAAEGFLSHVPPGRWVNHPPRNAAASNKLRQLSVARRLGADVPATVVTQVPGEAAEFLKSCGSGVVVKPLSGGMVERPGGGDTLIYTNLVTPAAEERLTDVAGCPTLFQEYVPKASDVRLTVIDGRAHAVELLAREADGTQRCDVRRRNMEDVEYRSVPVPAGVGSFTAALLSEFGLRFGALDFAVTPAGRWYFLEINPNGQWAWLDEAGACDIAGSLVEVFRHAQN